MKPAETASVLASHLVDILLQAGIPPGVLSFLPGPGAEIGSGLVRHPQVDIIAFTGSKEVGLSILGEAGHTSTGQVNIKKVVAELGGKNAIIVDDDADLDEALAGGVKLGFRLSRTEMFGLFPSYFNGTDLRNLYEPADSRPQKF